MNVPFANTFGHIFKHLDHVFKSKTLRSKLDKVQGIIETYINN
jgi:hypothetical protein